MSNRRFTLF